MIELRATTRVATIWFMDRHDQNWMAIVLKQEDGPWEGIYRFRYFADTKVFDSDDTRSWYRIAHETLTEEKLVEGFDEMATMLSTVGYSDEIRRIQVDGDGAAAQEALAGASWANLRTEKAAS